MTAVLLDDLHTFADVQHQSSGGPRSFIHAGTNATMAQLFNSV